VHVNGFTTWARSDVNTAHFVHAAWLRSAHHTYRVRKDWYGLYQWLYGWCGQFLEAWSYRRARLTVAVSRQVERELVATSLAPARLRVIANGVDLDEFKPAPAARAALGLPAGVLLLFVGDLKTPRKNLDTLLEAFALTPACRLLVVGDAAGSPYPELAARLGVANRVQFLGFRRDVAELMRAADVFVFPSRYEACSLVLLEAAASGLPVVAARTTGGTELLEGDGAVLLEDADDRLELAAVLRRLVAAPAVRAQMGAAARRTAERHSWAAMAAQYLGIYEELRSNAPPRALPSHQYGVP
jgi:glycosyltransferase involved in cell wall biosynthesis